MKIHQNMSHTYKLPAVPVRVQIPCVLNPSWVLEGVEFVRKAEPSGRNYTGEMPAEQFFSTFTALQKPDDILLFLRATDFRLATRVAPSLKSVLLKQHDRILDLANWMSLTAFNLAQRLVREASELQPADWDLRLSKRYPPELIELLSESFNLHVTALKPFAEAVSATGFPSLSTIGMILQLEALAGTTWKVCAHPNCLKVFKVESKHDRKFCEYRCAHSMTVRTLREKKRKAAASTRNKRRKADVSI